MTVSQILADLESRVPGGASASTLNLIDLAYTLKTLQEDTLALVPGGSGLIVGGTKGPGKIPKAQVDDSVIWDDDETADPGSAGTLDAVLAAGNTTDESIIFDETLTSPTENGDAVTKVWFRFENLSKAAQAAPYQPVPFQISQKAVVQGGDIADGGQVNETMMFGWNLNPGGGPEIGGRPGIGFSIESNYKDAGQRLVEFHDFYIPPTGEQIRIASYTCRTADFVIDYYHTVSRFYLKVPEIATPQNEKQYFAVTPSNTTGSISFGPDLGGRDGGIKAFTIEGNFAAGGGITITAAGLIQNEVFSQGILAWNLPGQRIASLAGQTNRKLLGSVQDQVIDDLENDNVAWSGTPSRAWRRGHFYNLHTRTKSGTPTTSDIPDGYWMVYKDTSGGSLRIWANDGGTMKSVTLT